MFVKLFLALLLITYIWFIDPFIITWWLSLSPIIHFVLKSILPDANITIQACVYLLFSVSSIYVFSTYLKIYIFCLCRYTYIEVLSNYSDNFCLWIRFLLKMCSIFFFMCQVIMDHIFNFLKVKFCRFWILLFSPLNVISFGLAGHFS